MFPYSAILEARTVDNSCIQAARYGSETKVEVGRNLVCVAVVWEGFMKGAFYQMLFDKGAMDDNELYFLVTVVTFTIFTHAKASSYSNPSLVAGATPSLERNRNFTSHDYGDSEPTICIPRGRVES
jgi:hypothetical protein